MSGQVAGTDNDAEIFRIVAENSLDSIVLVDSSAAVRFVSPSIFTITGYSVKEYESMPDAFDIIVPEDRDRVRQCFLHTLEIKQSVDIGYRIRHTQGHMVDVETRVQPVMDESGNVKYVVAMVRDVTARKQSERLLENILDNVGAAVWSTDKDFSRYAFCSDSMEKICGLPKEEVIVHPMRLHDQIHPDDNERMMGELKRELDHGIPIRHSFRWIHLKDEIRWAQLTVHPVTGYHGEIERLDGIILDITDKKRAELALEESEQRYKSLFEHNLDGVFSIELEGLRIVNANRAFEAITGLSSMQQVNRCFLGLIFDEDHLAVVQALREVIQLEAPRDIECRLAAVDGAERIMSITFVPIYLEGRLNGIHGIIKDITKRKQEERELIRSEERTKYLQMSLNRLSGDLTNVMKVAELERRLLDEVGQVLGTSEVWIEEKENGEAAGALPSRLIKIGEKPHEVNLCVRMNRPLTAAEEEWLNTAVRYATILYDNLHRTEDLMRKLEELMATNETPRWMMRLLFRLSEKERASLSSDLHDTVLQDLIIWYRKLESLRSSSSFKQDAQQELMQIEEGLLDAIHQIRITCNELRPPFLLKMGLVESLKSLFSYARMFSNYEIEFEADSLEAPLQEDQILGLYRIVQELLNNASKHSRAGKVTMSLRGDGEQVHFRYSDDGVGIDLSQLQGSFQHMGIAGIEKRVISLDGKVSFESAPKNGFRVLIQLPRYTTER